MVFQMAMYVLSCRVYVSGEKGRYLLTLLRRHWEGCVVTHEDSPSLSDPLCSSSFHGKTPNRMFQKRCQLRKGTICGLSDLLDPGSEDLRDRVAGCDRSGRARHGRREVADPAQRRFQESRSRNRQRSIHPIFWGTESWRYTTDLPQVPCQPFMPFLPGIGLFVSLDFSVKPKSKPAGR